MTLSIPFENPPDLFHLLRVYHHLFLIPTLKNPIKQVSVHSATQSNLIGSGDILTQIVIIQNNFFCSGCFHLAK